MNIKLIVHSQKSSERKNNMSSPKKIVTKTVAKKLIPRWFKKWSPSTKRLFAFIYLRNSLLVSMKGAIEAGINYDKKQLENLLDMKKGLKWALKDRDWQDMVSFMSYRLKTDYPKEVAKLNIKGL